MESNLFSAANDAHTRPVRNPVTGPPPFDSLPAWDISTVAHELFKVWDDGSELKWADTAWKHIVAARLAEGEPGHTAFTQQRCQVSLRFLALAALFSDWCYLIASVEPGGQFHMFIEELDISPFYLGLMLDPRTPLDEADDDGYIEEGRGIYDQRAIQRAVRILVERERPAVAQALLKGFGGPENLFVAFWRTRYPNPDGDYDYFVDAEYSLRGTSDDLGDRDASDETDEMILALSTPEKRRAWEWISQGCPTVKRV